MINLEKHDEGKQFISIRCASDYMAVPLAFFGLRLTAANIRYDAEEMLVEIPDSGFDWKEDYFSLNEIRSCNPEATISIFAVDFDEPGNRYYS